MIQKVAEYKKVCKARTWTLAVVGRETRGLVRGHSISDSSPVRYFYCVYVHSLKKKPIIIVVVVIVIIII